MLTTRYLVSIMEFRLMGPQKGANENSIILLMNYFNHLINLLENKKLSISSQSLSGAGGGIPASLQIFYNTPLYSSQDFILQDIGLKSLTDEVDYLITGEGSFNHQSSFGKGAGILIDLFKSSVKKYFWFADILILLSNQNFQIMSFQLS